VTVRQPSGDELRALSGNFEFNRRNEFMNNKVSLHEYPRAIAR